MTWNAFLDKIDYGLFPNLILVMTSNQEIKLINMINLIYVMEELIFIVSFDSFNRVTKK